MKRWLTAWALMTLAGVGGFSCAAHAETLPSVEIMSVEGAYTVDGLPGEPFWETLPRHGSFHTVKRHPQDHVPVGETSFRIARVGETLLVITETEQEEVSVAQRQSGSPEVCSDDSVELFLHTEGGPLYQFAVNAEGYTFFQVVGEGWRPGPEWSPRWEAATSHDGKRWRAELAVDLVNLEYTPGTTWRLNVARTWRERLIYQSWAPVLKGYAERERHGNLQWQGKPPGHQWLRASLPGLHGLERGIHRLPVRWEGVPEGRYRLAMRENGQWRSIGTEKSPTAAVLTAELDLSVASATGQSVTVALTEAESDRIVSVWQGPVSPAPLLTVKLPWPVYTRTGPPPRAVATLALSDASQAEGTLEVTLRQMGSNRQWTTALPLAGKRVHECELPADFLSDGSYEIEVSVKTRAWGGEHWRGSFHIVPPVFLTQTTPPTTS